MACLGSITNETHRVLVTADLTPYSDGKDKATRLTGGLKNGKLSGRLPMTFRRATVGYRRMPTVFWLQRTLSLRSAFFVAILHLAVFQYTCDSSSSALKRCALVGCYERATSLSVPIAGLPNSVHRECPTSRNRIADLWHTRWRMATESMSLRSFQIKTLSGTL